MPDQLTDEERQALLQRVAAEAPKGLTEDQWNARAQAAITQMERFSPEQRRTLQAPFTPGGQKPARSLGDIGQNIKNNLPALSALAVSAGFVNPATTGAISRIAGPAIAGSRWLQPIATGMGATGGAVARGDQPGDAIEEGVKTAAIGRYAPAVVEKVMNIPSAIGAKGMEMARGYLKPALDAGRQEAQRLFGRSAMASNANEKIVKRALDRGILGADNPEQAVGDAIEDVSKKLDKVVGDQPTRLNNILNSVFQRGRNAALEQGENIPAAQAAIEAKIEGVRTGRLGGKLDYGTARPPAATDTVSSRSLVNAMQGPEASAGKVAPPDPKIIHGLQRIEAQPAGGNITTGAVLPPSAPKGPALAVTHLEGQRPAFQQTPPRYAGSGSTEVMREAPPGTPTGDVIARNFTPPVKAAPTSMPLTASHRPQNVTAKESLDFARRLSNRWERAPSSLIDWFDRSIESGARTATKQAVPEARPLLDELGELMSTKRVVSQAANREGNKNAFMRLPAMLAALKASNPVAAGGMVAGGAALDRNTGKIAQNFYDFGKNYQPDPATIQGMKDSTLAMALTQLLKQRSGQ